MEKNELAKRRLNFLAGEDYYFLTYQLLLLLDVLTSDSGKFKDHRKLAYLIHIASSTAAMSVIRRHAGRAISNADDKEVLFSTFTTGELHKRDVYKLLWALEKRGMVQVERSETPDVIDVTLARQSIPESFLNNDVFGGDRDTAKALKMLFGRIAGLSLDTFLTKFYRDYGISVWAL